MKSKKLIFYCVASVLLCVAFGNLNAQWTDMKHTMVGQPINIVRGFYLSDSVL